MMDPEKTSRCPRESSAPPFVLCLLCALLLVSGCTFNQEDRLDCDDILPASETHFSELTALMMPVGGKGCGGLGCHGAEKPSKGLRFDTPGLIFDAINKRPFDTYGRLAAGTMPIVEQGGTRWDETDLRIYRSWVCRGGFPDE